MKKILIVGISSFVGHHLAVHLRERHHVLGTYNERRPRIDGVPMFRLKIEPGPQHEALLQAVRPEIVIYCPGIADEKRCSADPLGTLFLNADGPALLAAAIEPWGGKFIYLSTSRVFSGEDGDYEETTSVSPRTIYGSAKARGEEILGIRENTLSLRIGNIFGWSLPTHPVFLRRLIGHFWNKTEIPLICDEYRNFISVDDVARFIGTIAEGKFPTGTLHLSDGTKMTFYGFSRIAAQVFDAPTSLLHPITGTEFSKVTGNAGYRGRDLSLSGAKLYQEVGFLPAPAEAGLRAIREKLKSGFI